MRTPCFGRFSDAWADECPVTGELSLRPEHQNRNEERHMSVKSKARRWKMWAIEDSEGFIVHDIGQEGEEVPVFFTERSHARRAMCSDGSDLLIRVEVREILPKRRKK